MNYVIYDENIEEYDELIEDEEFDSALEILEETLAIAQKSYDYIKNTDAPMKEKNIDYYRLGKVYRYLAYHYIKLQNAEMVYKYLTEEIKILKEIYEYNGSEKTLETLNYELSQLSIITEIMNEE